MLFTAGNRDENGHAACYQSAIEKIPAWDNIAPRCRVGPRGTTVCDAARRRVADYSALSGVTRSSVGITLPLVTIAMCSNCDRM